MEKEDIYGQTDLHMKVILLKAFVKVKELGNLHPATLIHTLDLTKMIKKMVMEDIFGQTVVSTKVSLSMMSSNCKII